MGEHRQRRASMARRKKRRIGAFSKRLTFSDLDGRTNAGKYVNAIKNDLEAQIGNPSPGQQILIKLAAVKMLRCEMMYERVLSQPDSGDLQDRVENYFLAWSNSVRRRPGGARRARILPQSHRRVVEDQTGGHDQ
jgi:hypothetical protein